MPVDPPALMTTTEVASLLRVSESQVKKLAADPDELRGVHRVKVGSVWRFARADLVAYTTGNGNGHHAS